MLGSGQLMYFSAAFAGILPSLTQILLAKLKWADQLAGSGL